MAEPDSTDGGGRGAESPTVRWDPAAPRFGIRTQQTRPYEELRELWQRYEAMGFDSLWLGDHLISPTRPGAPYYEAWSLLPALATCTSTVRLGVMVSCATLRHPALLARAAATVDHVSGGRLELGLGAGWYTPEHDAFGIPLATGPEPVEAFAETVEVCDRLLRGEVVSFAGRHLTLRGAFCAPAPRQRPRPPLTVGAHGPRMLAVAARFADVWNSYRLDGPGEVRRRNEMLDEACLAAGRAPADVRRSLLITVRRPNDDPWASVDAFRDAVGRYGDAGIQEFVFDMPLECQYQVLERVAVEVLPQLRRRSDGVRSAHEAV